MMQACKLALLHAFSCMHKESACCRHEMMHACRGLYSTENGQLLVQNACMMCMHVSELFLQEKGSRMKVKGTFLFPPLN